MENTNTTASKLFIGFGIMTIISGIYLVFQKDYLIGFSGSCVGIWLLMSNIKAIKGAKGE